MSINDYLFMLVYQGAGYYPLLDRFFILLTSWITYGVCASVTLYLVVYPFMTPEPRERLRRLGMLAETSIALFVTWVLQWAIKVVVAYPRPFVALANVKPLVAALPYESFPSSHAALTMALAIAVLPYHKQLGYILIAFSFVVALSRLYVGVHYPFDIGVGLLIGYSIPKIIHRIFRAQAPKVEPRVI